MEDMIVMHKPADLEKLKEFAKILYTRDKLTQEETAEKTGVHVNTIGKWSAEGNWKMLRRNLVLTRQEQLAFMMEELVELNASIQQRPKGKRFPEYKEVMSRDRMIANITALEAKVSVRDVIDVSIGLLEFIRPIDLEKTREISDWLDQYIKTFD